MVKCDLCGSNENVLENHYEAHVRKRMNICLKCHGHLHIAIYFHGYDKMWREGFGEHGTREMYGQLHKILVEKGLIRCGECGMAKRYPWKHKIF